MERAVWLAVKAGSIVLLTMAVGVAGSLIVRPSLASYRQEALKPSAPEEGKLRVTFMGVATLAFDDDSTVILTDGFFSRPALWQLIAQKVGPDERKIATALERSGLERIDAVWVAHSHFDHALDSATVAKKAMSSPSLYGSRSSLTLASNEELSPTAMRLIHPREQSRIGAFLVTPFRSEHSTGLLFAFPGEIEPESHPPARISAYREGGTYSFLVEHPQGRMLVHPSANFVPGMYHGVYADVVFLGIAGLGRAKEGFVENYWREVVRETGAALVVPIHWDDFTRPLEEPVDAMPWLFDDIGAAMERLSCLAKQDHVAFRMMPVLEPVDVISTARLQSPRSSETLAAHANRRDCSEP